MLISQDLLKVSSGARRPTGVTGLVALAVAMRDAKMGLISELSSRVPF